MTTPKELEDLRFWLKEVIYAPQYAGKIINAVPKLIAAIEGNQKLAEEFRRLAAATRRSTLPPEALPESWRAEERAATWEQAAQMLEEKVNG